MRPVVCMITDGRAEPGFNPAALLARIRTAVRAGVDLVQVREHRLDTRELGALVAGCVDVVRGTPARVLVNDRLDVALAAGAHGVHLRGDGVAASRIRRFTPRGFLVGRSVHERDEAIAVAADGGVDYLMFGTVFDSTSKPGRAPAGMTALVSLVRATPLPVLAVGGVTSDRVRAVAQTGAAGWAAISLFQTTPLETLQRQLAQGALAFDTSEELA